MVLHTGIPSAPDCIFWRTDILILHPSTTGSLNAFNDPVVDGCTASYGHHPLAASLSESQLGLEEGKSVDRYGMTTGRTTTPSLTTPYLTFPPPMHLMTP